MGELLTLDLPDDVAECARTFAKAMNRRIEDAAVDWIRDAVSESPLANLPDKRVLELCA